MKTKEIKQEVRLNDWIEKILIGKHDNEKIFLSPPKWACGWYWGFGYLGNKDCHYHVDGLNKYENINLFDAFKKHFGETLVIKNDDDLWTLVELFQSFYVLKEAAEVLGRGGAHCSNNPCEKVILNKKEVKRINEKVLPAIFLEIYKILLKYS